MGTEKLRVALMHVHAELSGTADGLEGEELEATKALQDETYDVLDMCDYAAEAAAAPDRETSAAPAIAAATTHPAAPAASRGARCESEGSAALEGAKEVAALEAKGKMAAASAKLQSLPLGKHVGARTIAGRQRRAKRLHRRLRAIRRRH